MQRCLGCMREFEGEFVCPHCGYFVGTEAASKNHLAPGTVLQDRYLLGKVLGQGGFGITYIAWDNKLGRAVAIKEYMPSAFASRMTGDREISCYNEEAQQQFSLGLEKTLRETSALAQFNGLESIVQVHDCIRANKTAYIIMELLRGQTVSALQRQRGKLSFTETLRIIRPILQTLDAMHQEGMIHRDVAPDNIFVCDNGKVKLLDFGAARIVSGDNQKTLSVVLKRGYAPFEQYSNKSSQGAFTDVYAASATIYKMLTGINPPDSLDRMEADTLRPIGDFAQIPPQAEEAILHGMAVRANERTQTAAQLLAELENTAFVPTPPRPPVPVSVPSDPVPSEAETEDVSAQPQTVAQEPEDMPETIPQAQPDRKNTAPKPMETVVLPEPPADADRKPPLLRIIASVLAVLLIAAVIAVVAKLLLNSEPDAPDTTAPAETVQVTVDAADIATFGTSVQDDSTDTPEAGRTLTTRRNTATNPIAATTLIENGDNMGGPDRGGVNETETAGAPATSSTTEPTTPPSTTVSTTESTTVPTTVSTTEPTTPKITTTTTTTTTNPIHMG